MGIDWKVVASKQLNLTAFNINRTLNTSGAQVIGGGASTPTSAEDFRVIMDMLKTFGDVKTLSTPRIMATDGQEAKILVGSKKAYVTDTVTQTNSGTNTAEQVQFVDVGVKLYVTPTINKDGFITMKIRPEVSSTTSNYTTAQGNTVPIVDTSEAETSVLVKDGVTVVMGGLMKNEKNKSTYKLPLLGEVPFLGALFRRTEDVTTKTELVIFLTPHIISGAENMFGENKKTD
jgi:type II secretory pathway component GspD/PulD (secretin)